MGSTSVSRTSCSMLSCSPLLWANAALWPNIASFSCTFLCCSPSYIHLHTRRTGCIYMSSAAMSLLSVSDPPTSGPNSGPKQQFRSFYDHRNPGWSNWWHTTGWVQNTICCHDLSRERLVREQNLRQQFSNYQECQKLKLSHGRKIALVSVDGNRLTLELSWVRGSVFQSKGIHDAPILKSALFWLKLSRGVGLTTPGWLPTKAYVDHTLVVEKRALYSSVRNNDYCLKYSLPFFLVGTTGALLVIIV